MLLSNPPGVSALLLPTVVCSKARIFQRVKRNHIDPLKKKKKVDVGRRGGGEGRQRKTTLGQYSLGLCVVLVPRPQLRACSHLYSHGALGGKSQRGEL